MWDSSKGSEPLLDDDVIGHLIKIPFHFIEHHLLTMMSLVDNGDYLDTVLSWVCLHFTHTTLKILYTIGHLLIPRLAGGLLITQRREIELRIKVMPRSVHTCLSTTAHPLLHSLIPSHLQAVKCLLSYASNTGLNDKEHKCGWNMVPNFGDFPESSGAFLFHIPTDKCHRRF